MPRCVWRVENRGLHRNAWDMADGPGWLACLAGTVCILAICVYGCTGSEATPSVVPEPSLGQSMFSSAREPSACPARCVPSAVAVALEGLGLDPEGKSKRRGLDAATIFESLEREGADAGATITRVALEDVIENLPEGPMAPVVLIHKTGHLSVLFGTIRVNDELLCQVVHGGEAVSLVTGQTLLEAKFQEAWRLGKTNGARVPIHIGSAIVEIDKLWHNFGEALPDKSLECTFRLKNVGDRAVILGKPVASCQCTVPNIGEKTILARDQALDLKVILKAANVTSLRNSIALPLYEQGSGVSRHVQLSLIASQRGSMTVVPEELDFGTIVPNKSCDRTLCLREKPTDRFLVNEVQPGKLPIAHIVEMVSDKYGLATYRIHLELKVDSGCSGHHREELIVTTTSHVRPRVVVPVVFQIEPPVRTIPSVVSVGTIAVGESRERRVQFVSRSGEALHIDIESHPNECSITVDNNKSPLEMVVTVQVKEAGIWEGIIRTKVRSLSQERLVYIRCVGFARHRSE